MGDSWPVFSLGLIEGPVDLLGSRTNWFRQTPQAVWPQDVLQGFFRANPSKSLQHLLISYSSLRIFMVNAGTKFRPGQLPARLVRQPGRQKKCWNAFFLRMLFQGCRFGPESKPNPGKQYVDSLRYHLWRIVSKNVFRGQICNLGGLNCLKNNPS